MAKPIRFLLSTISILLMIGSSWLYAQTQPLKQAQITVYTEQFPPYNYEYQGKLTGLNLHLVKVLCNKVNVDCKFELYPWLRSYNNALNDPNGGLVSTARTPQRESLFKWVGPLMHGNSALYRLASRTDLAPKTLQDARQHVVAIVRGDLYEQILTENGFSLDTNLVAFSSRIDALAMLLKGKVDYIIGSEIVIPYWLWHLGRLDEELVPTVALPGIPGNYLALNPAIDDKIVEAMTKELDHMRKTGELNTIIRTFFEEQGLATYP